MTTGWLEGGLCASCEKFIMDCETIQQIIHYMQPVKVGREELESFVERRKEQGGRRRTFNPLVLDSSPGRSTIKPIRTLS